MPREECHCCHVELVAQPLSAAVATPPNIARGFRWRTQRQPDDEGAALALLALHRDRPPVQLHQIARTRQPQTAAREAPDHVRSAMETLENLRQLVEGHHDLNSYAERVCSILTELVSRKAA